MLVGEGPRPGGRKVIPHVPRPAAADAQFAIYPAKIIFSFSDAISSEDVCNIFV